MKILKKEDKKVQTDIKQILKDLLIKIGSSRVLILFLIYLFLVFTLILKLFDLQIIKGEYYQKNYIQKIEKKIVTSTTRGNIYDRKGNVLAYNKLAYAVTIRDNGDYKHYSEKNLMIYNLVKILQRHKEEVLGSFFVGINEDGEYFYKVTSELNKKRFLREFYGLKSIDELDKNSKYKSDISAKELVDKKFADYKLKELETKNNIVLSDKEKLDIINIRYTLGLNAYHKYDAIKIASDIKEELKVELFENSFNLLGLNIEEENLRVYNDSIYFSSILGYTGRVLESQLEELKQKSEDYTENDIVGRVGLEQYMDLELRGKKGHRSIYVDNVGHILELKDEVLSSPGNSLYLSLDRDLQIGTYHLLEQQLAGILVQKIVNDDNPNTKDVDSTNRKIPVKKAYYQLIANNVLKTSDFKDAKASEIEKNIYAKYQRYYRESIDKIEKEIKDSSVHANKDLDAELREFINFIYAYLSSDETKIILKKDEYLKSLEYKAWKDEDLSFNQHIRYLVNNNLIDITKLSLDNKYLSSEDVYLAIISHIINELKSNIKFEKLLYKQLIKNNVIKGRELCLCLYEQKVLEYDDKEYKLLYENSENYAYHFLIKQISKIKITPSMLALEPSTASAVISDVNSGKVLALVSYPGYDNNRLSNNMDVEYYNKLLNDESLPLYNNATQSRKAPGSTFKPISAIAGLEEGIVDEYDKIACRGEYDIIKPSIKCWIYPGFHDKLDLRSALTSSCNIYFTEIGHKLSLNKDGEYNAQYGLERLRKYAELFGLSNKTGIEIGESKPIITTSLPEQSAIGQGTNSFANIHLSRYALALANKGNLYKLSLLDKLIDKDNNLLEYYESKLENKIDLKESTWKAVRSGMRQVMTEGTASSLFKDLGVEVAGKTGTAQESKTRANHAYFISFAPYDKPEVAITVNIPYGYTSSNAVTAAKNIYKLYFGYTNLDLILKNSALDVTNVKIGD